MILKESQPSMKELIQLMESASKIKFQSFMTEKEFLQELHSKNYGKLYENLEPSIKHKLDKEIDDFLNIDLYDHLVEEVLREYQEDLLLEGIKDISANDIKLGLQGLSSDIQNSETLKKIAIHSRKAMRALTGPFMKKMLGEALLVVHKGSVELLKKLFNMPRYIYRTIYALTFGLLGTVFTKTQIALGSLGALIGVPYLMNWLSANQAGKDAVSKVGEIIQSSGEGTIIDSINVIEKGTEYGVEQTTGIEVDWNWTQGLKDTKDAVGDFTSKMWDKIRGVGDADSSLPSDMPEIIIQPSFWDNWVEQWQNYQAGDLLRSDSNSRFTDKVVDGFEGAVHCAGYVLEQGGYAAEKGFNALMKIAPQVNDYCQAMGYGNVIAMALVIVSLGAAHQGVKNTLENGLPWVRSPGWAQKLKNKMFNKFNKVIQKDLDKTVNKAMEKYKQEQQAKTGKTQ